MYERDLPRESACLKQGLAPDLETHLGFVRAGRGRSSCAAGFRKLPVIGKFLASTLAIVTEPRTFVEDKFSPFQMHLDNACVYFLRAGMNAQSVLGYIVVSGICLLLNNAILIFADFGGCTLFVSVLISYAIVVVVGYVLHSLVSFRQPFGVAAFGRYAFAMAANIPLLFIATWLWRDLAGLPMSSAAPIATTFMVFINFALSRWAISGNDKTVGQ